MHTPHSTLSSAYSSTDPPCTMCQHQGVLKGWSSFSVTSCADGSATTATQAIQTSGCCRNTKYPCRQLDQSESLLHSVTRGYTTCPGNCHHAPPGRNGREPCFAAHEIRCWAHIANTALCIVSPAGRHHQGLSSVHHQPHHTNFGPPKLWNPKHPLRDGCTSVLQAVLSTA